MEHATTKLREQTSKSGAGIASLTPKGHVNRAPTRLEDEAEIRRSQNVCSCPIGAIALRHPGKVGALLPCAFSLSEGAPVPRSDCPKEQRKESRCLELCATVGRFEAPRPLPSKPRQPPLTTRHGTLST